MNPPQDKPLHALKKLSDPKRRLVNKLIISLAGDQIDEKVQASINKTINRARRSPDEHPKYYNGYMVFYKEQFSKLKKTDSVTVIAKTLGKQWRALTDEERATYNNNARLQAIGKPTEAKESATVGNPRV